MQKARNKKIIFILSFVIINIGFFSFTKNSLAVDVIASASRTTGVAPLAVHFNADLTASSPTERSFHDYHYAWDFGDSDSGNWGTDGKFKNTDTGPIAAHVYEIPGTYSVTLTVIDPATGNHVTSLEETFTITVTDPDIVFAGTNTTCISDINQGDFTGCPSGANQVITSDISNLSAYSGEGKRTLFHRGSSWDITTNIVWGSGSTSDTPKTIGAFGACIGPDVLGICSNAPHIRITTDTETSFINLSYKHNLRLMDIYVSATSITYDNTSMIEGKNDIKDFLALRLKGKNLGLGITTASYRKNDIDYPDKIAIVSSSFSSTWLQPVYIGGERLAVLGNILADGETSHVFRVWHSYLGVISHNTVYGSSIANDQGRHAFKLHGPYDGTTENPGVTSVGTYEETGSGGKRNRTDFNIVSSNIFGASGPWTVSIGPQSSNWDERITDLIFEKNRTIADYGTLSSRLVMVGVMAEGKYMSFRNNIFDGTGGTSGYIGLMITQRGIEPAPEHNQIFNNTMYRSDTQSGDNTGATISSTAINTIVRNNLVSFPNVTGTTKDVIDVSSVSTVSNNVYTNAPYLNAPNNSDPLLRDFSLNSLATVAINQGYAVPVYDDFFGDVRNGIFDIGAFEYQSVTIIRADVDNNSTTNTTDALLTLRNSLGLSMTATAWQASATTGDVDCNGVTNSTDALLILRYSLGLAMGETSWCE